MNSPDTSVPPVPIAAFAPLPLRARSPMEVLDVAVRVYKQYFWTLVAWSALVVVGRTILSLTQVLGLMAFCLAPLVTGACICSIAAAVRGQDVTFKQCGDFSRSRYGPMLGMYFLCFLVLVAAALVIGIVLALLIAAIGSVVGWDVLWLMVLLIALGTVGSIFLISCSAIWFTFVQIVVCMEDEHRSTSALRRAYDLLRGHWIRVSGLVTMLGLGFLVLSAILAAVGVLFVGLGSVGDLMQGRVSDTATWGIIGVWAVCTMVISTLWSPVFYLTLSLFYLDIRIRKEALDLEWTAHTTTPQQAFQEFQSGSAGWAGPGAGAAASTGGFVGLPAGADGTPGNPGGRPGEAWYDALPTGPTAPVPSTHAAPVAGIAPRVICDRCGASVLAGDFCSNCGAALPAPAGEPATFADTTGFAAPAGRAPLTGAPLTGAHLTGAPLTGATGPGGFPSFGQTPQDAGSYPTGQATVAGPGALTGPGSSDAPAPGLGQTLPPDQSRTRGDTPQSTHSDSTPPGP